jgi:hypothetical protein
MIFPVAGTNRVTGTSALGCPRQQMKTRIQPGQIGVCSGSV